MQRIWCISLWQERTPCWDPTESLHACAASCFSERSSMLEIYPGFDERDFPLCSFETQLPPHCLHTFRYVKQSPLGTSPRASHVSVLLISGAAHLSISRCLHCFPHGTNGRAVSFLQVLVSHWICSLLTLNISTNYFLSSGTCVSINHLPVKKTY